MHRYIRTQRPVIRLRWAGCGALHADGLHLAPSVSKSFAGTLAAMLVSEGAPDPSAPVSRHFDETHADLDAVVWKFARADVLFPRLYNHPRLCARYVSDSAKIRRWAPLQGSGRDGRT